METESYWTEIGRLGRSHGKRGQLRCYIEAPFQEEFILAEFIYTDLKGDKVPYFITEREGEEGEYLLRFEDILHPEGARTLSGGTLYWPTRMLSDMSRLALAHDDKQIAHGYVGYTLEDISSGQHFTVDQVIEYPAQWMLEVSTGDSSHLIPLVEAYIVQIDPDQRHMKLSLPEGIFSI